MRTAQVAVADTEPPLIGRILQSSVDIIPWRARDMIRRIPVVRSLQRWIISRFLDGTSFVHTVSAGPARGVRFAITLPDDKLIWTGTWEIELAEAISRTVRRGDVCLDIGSYRGFFAGVMAVAGAARVYCFEPSPSNLARIEELKRLNPGLPIEVHQLAVADRDGEMDFAVMSEATMGKLVSSPFQADAPPLGTIRVRTATLDTLVESGVVAAPALIKIDVEGAELEVLAGARRLLARRGPRLFIEAHSFELARGCASELERIGYVVSVLETGGSVGSARMMAVCHLVATRP